MIYMTPVLGIPRLGIYSDSIREFFESLGCQVVMPKKVTQEMIRPGVMHSSDMICYPYKVTLGQEIWCLEHGATDLAMFSTEGLCRFKHYHQLLEITLRNLGYEEFTMHTFTMANFLPKLVSITGASVLEIISRILPIPFQLEEIEERAYRSNGNNSLNALKVGIVGEFYTMVESDINYDIVRKLQSMGVDVHMSITLSEFLKNAIYLDYFGKQEEKREAKRLLTDEIGGHGFHSIYNTAWYGKLNFDGIIHLMPLSCFPAGTIINGNKLRKIEQVRKSDEVLTHQRRLRKVIDTTCRDYKGELVSIEYMEYQQPGYGTVPLRITLEHPIWAVKKHSNPTEPSFIPANKLSVDDFVVTVIPYKNSKCIGVDAYLTPIKAISKELFNGVVYNLEIEEDNSYGAQNVLVHNCMPESTVEVLVDQVARKYGIPLYRFPIDENNFEAGFNTRLETFTSMLRRKKANEH